MALCRLFDDVGPATTGQDTRRDLGHCGRIRKSYCRGTPVAAHSSPRSVGSPPGWRSARFITLGRRFDAAGSLIGPVLRSHAHRASGRMMWCHAARIAKAWSGKTPTDRGDVNHHCRMLPGAVFSEGEIAMNPDELAGAARKLAHALGIPVYIRDGRIYQHGPGREFLPSTGARPTVQGISFDDDAFSIKTDQTA